MAPEEESTSRSHPWSCLRMGFVAHSILSMAFFLLQYEFHSPPTQWNFSSWFPSLSPTPVVLVVTLYYSHWYLVLSSNIVPCGHTPSWNFGLCPMCISCLPIRQHDAQPLRRLDYSTLGLLCIWLVCHSFATSYVVSLDQRFFLIQSKTTNRSIMLSCSMMPPWSSVSSRSPSSPLNDSIRQVVVTAAILLLTMIVSTTVQAQEDSISSTTSTFTNYGCDTTLDACPYESQENGICDSELGSSQSGCEGGDCWDCDRFCLQFNEDCVACLQHG